MSVINRIQVSGLANSQLSHLLMCFTTSQIASLGGKVKSKSKFWSPLNEKDHF